MLSYLLTFFSVSADIWNHLSVVWIVPRGRTGHDLVRICMYAWIIVNSYSFVQFTREFGCQPTIF